jgi:hypothetical protein
VRGFGGSYFAASFAIVLVVGAMLCIAPAAIAVEYPLSSANSAYPATYGAPGQSDSLLGALTAVEGDEAMVSLVPTTGVEFLIPRYRFGASGSGTVFEDNQLYGVRFRKTNSGSSAWGEFKLTTPITGQWGAIILVYTSAIHEYSPWNDWTYRGGQVPFQISGNAFHSSYNAATVTGVQYSDGSGANFPMLAGSNYVTRWIPMSETAALWNTGLGDAPLPGKQLLANGMVVISWVPYDATRSSVRETHYIQIQGSHGSGWYKTVKNDYLMNNTYIGTGNEPRQFVKFNPASTAIPFAWHVIDKYSYKLGSADTPLEVAWSYQGDVGFGSTSTSSTVQAVHDNLHAGKYVVDQSRYFVEDFEPPPLDPMDPGDDPNTWLNGIFEDLTDWYTDNVSTPVTSAVQSVTDWLWILSDFGSWFGGA